jgi:hypothetical protein
MVAMRRGQAVAAQLAEERCGLALGDQRRFSAAAMAARDLIQPQRPHAGLLVGQVWHGEALLVVAAAAGSSCGRSPLITESTASPSGLTSCWLAKSA